MRKICKDLDYLWRGFCSAGANSLVLELTFQFACSRVRGSAPRIMTRALSRRESPADARQRHRDRTALVDRAFIGRPEVAAREDSAAGATSESDGSAASGSLNAQAH